jgi:hypothetical protein
MTQISLADLIVRRVPLAPREAATLTLAVAREWHRQRSLYGPVALPDIAAIRLKASGEIAFLVTPRTGADDEPGTLSTLFARLLGDEAELPRPLIDFTDDDPATLRAIFWRYASETRMERRSRRPTRERRPPVHERRAAGETVMVLRRSIRSLERQVFESQHAIRSALPPFFGHTSRATRPLLAAVALLILLVGGFSAVQVRPATPTVVTASPAVSQVAEAGVTQPHGPHPIRAAHERSVAPTPPVRSATRTRVRRPRPLPASARVAPSPAQAGGTRGIIWMQAR